MKDKQNFHKIFKHPKIMLQRCTQILAMYMSIQYVCTVLWPEILVGNSFWRIGGFESNLPIFDPPKLYSVMSSLLRNHSFHVYNRPAAVRVSVIVGMEFTIDSCARSTLKCIGGAMAPWLVHNNVI